MSSHSLLLKWPDGAPENSPPSDCLKNRKTQRAILPMSSDLSRITRAMVDGDEAAFQEFYDLYSGRLRGFLFVLTSGNEELTRELHQGVMVKVARKFKVFNEEAELWAWLSQVARNAFIDHGRKQARGFVHRMAESMENQLDLKANETELHFLEWLEQGLQALDAEERSLVEAVYFDKRAQKDVAMVNGQTVKAVESKLARIRLKLRTFILNKTKYER